jgi:uncharacterized phiE125 gp8 family phage protein
LAEPVSLAEAKAQVRMVEDNSEDTFITSLIAPARAYVERVSRNLFVEGERTETFRRWGDYLELWRKPVVSVDTVTYSTSDDPADDIEYTGFAADYNSFPLRIYPAFGGTGFPTLVAGRLHGWGFGNDGRAIPAWQARNAFTHRPLVRQSRRGAAD